MTGKANGHDLILLLIKAVLGLVTETWLVVGISGGKLHVQR